MTHAFHVDCVVIIIIYGFPSSPFCLFGSCRCIKGRNLNLNCVTFEYNKRNRHRHSVQRYLENVKLHSLQMLLRSLASAECSYVSICGYENLYMHFCIDSNFVFVENSIRRNHFGPVHPLLMRFTGDFAARRYQSG